MRLEYPYRVFMKIIGFYSRELRAVKDYFFQSNEVLWIYWYSGLSHLCKVLSGAPNGLNIVRVRHAWYEVNSRVKICTWPKTNICLKIKVSMLQLFQQGLYKKVSHPEKIVCLLDITYINQYKSLWPCPVFKPSKQVQMWVSTAWTILPRPQNFVFSRYTADV